MENDATPAQAVLLGFKQEGPESPNCYEDDLHDFHMWMGSETASTAKARTALRDESVVVEPTPRMQEKHPSWTKENLQTIVGKRIRVTGWLMFDSEHPNQIGKTRATLFFPIAVNVAAGLATVEPELEDVLRSLGATRVDIILKVGLPRSLPYFFASLKIAITLAFVGAVIAETMASNEGIGTLIVQASSNLRIPLVFAALTVIAVMSIVMYVGFAVIERRTTGWATRSTDFGIGG